MSDPSANTRPGRKRRRRRPRRGELRPLAASARWRVQIVLMFCVLAVVLFAIGDPLPLFGNVTLGAWFVLALVVSSAVRRLRRGGRTTAAETVATLGFVGDCTVQLLLHLDSGGGPWMACAMFIFSAFAINASLPRRLAAPVSLYAVLLYGGVVYAEVTGRVSGHATFGPSTIVGQWKLALVTALVGAALIICAATVQQTLMIAMRRAGARHRLVLESATDMIFTLDGALRFDTLNAAVTRESGFAPDQLAGHPFAPILVPEDAPRALAHLERALGGVGQRFETRYRRKDGAVRWLAVTASPVRERNDVVAVLAVARDVTDARAADEHRERMQTQLAQSQKMDAVGQLVSGVAHELNNPLAAILTFTEELLSEARMPADEQALRTIGEQARRARAIVRDLRAFVRQGDGGGERAHPADVVERVVRAAGKVARDAHATVTVNVAPDAPPADIPLSALEQVVANLVLNAIHAVGGNGGGRVTVNVGGTPTAAELVVEDDGPGIAPEVLPHIFEPFFTTRPTGQGAGLGLSVSLGIVEQYGGTLVVEPREPGAGARFVVRLPTLAALDPLTAATAEFALPRPPRASTPPSSHVAVGVTPPPAAPTPAAVPAVAEQTSARVPRRRVLVIDDEESIRLALRRFFSRRGWEVDDAGNGSEALAKLGDAAPNAYGVILCDLKMPGLSGPEFYAELERTAPHWLDRLILSTGDVASPDAAAFLATAKSPVLEKPFELSALAAAVDGVYASTAGQGA